MIIANAKQHPGFMHLEIVWPDKQARQYKIVENEHEAKRLVYFLNRKYILEKLTGWLNQRQKALRGTNVGERYADSAKLQVLLQYYNKAALHGLCQFISKHRQMFEGVAPNEASDHRAYYNNTIRPILDFCDWMS
jgi:(p)ppGpp synthase/HD superfamily hydrolase